MSACCRTRTWRLIDNPFLTVGVLNTSIASENGGDFIIMEAALGEIAQCLPLAFKIHLATHEKLSRTSLRLQGKVAFNIACGTNLLHSHMEIIKQWNVGLFAACFLKPVVLLGVGWRGRASRKTTFFTKRFLRKLLSREHLHSVRDSYTESRLREIGVENVINTACPSMWPLTPEHCLEIPVEKGDDVVMTLTDYSRDPRQDRQLFDVLKRSYRHVYFWLQGSADYQYLTSIAGMEKVRIVPSSLAAFDDLLSDRSLSLDYAGTRLHGGIRALQHKRRSLIVGVDHRAMGMAGDFGLPVADRYLPIADLEHAVCSDRPCTVNLPMDNIRRWKAQWESVKASPSLCPSYD